MLPSTVLTLAQSFGFQGQAHTIYSNISTSVQSVPDKLIVIEEGGVFDQTEALFHSVNEGLDL